VAARPPAGTQGVGGGEGAAALRLLPLMLRGPPVTGAHHPTRPRVLPSLSVGPGGDWGPGPMDDYQDGLGAEGAAMAGFEAPGPMAGMGGMGAGAPGDASARGRGS